MSLQEKTTKRKDVMTENLPTYAVFKMLNPPPHQTWQHISVEHQEKLSATCLTSFQLPNKNKNQDYSSLTCDSVGRNSPPFVMNMNTDPGCITS